jgi:hypothetical protein
MLGGGGRTHADENSGNEEIDRRALEDRAARYAFRVDTYRSESFRLEASRLLSVSRTRFDLAVDALLIAGAIPRSRPESPQAAEAEDACFIIAALGAGTSDSEKLLYLAKRVLLMEFQFEYGRQATNDRKGMRKEPTDPCKERFGNQLAKTIREIWENEGEAATAASVAIGWAPGCHDAFGVVEYKSPRREVAFLYSSADLFTGLHEGIGVFRDIELNLLRKIEVNAGALLSAAEALALGEAIPDLVRDTARYVISDPSTNTGWTHLFERRERLRGRLSDVIRELECRFVYDRFQHKLLHLDVIEQGVVTTASEADRRDLEDSLEDANPDAIESPSDQGLDVSNELPAWCKLDPG